MLKVIEVETPTISATEKNLWADFADVLLDDELSESPLNESDSGGELRSSRSKDA